MIISSVHTHLHTYTYIPQKLLGIYVALEIYCLVELISDFHQSTEQLLKMLPTKKYI